MEPTFFLVNCFWFCFASTFELLNLFIVIRHNGCVTSCVLTRKFNQNVLHDCVCVCVSVYVFAIAFEANVSSQTRARKWCARMKGREKNIQEKQELLSRMVSRPLR